MGLEFEGNVWDTVAGLHSEGYSFILTYSADQRHLTDDGAGMFHAMFHKGRKQFSAYSRHPLSAVWEAAYKVPDRSPA